MNIIQSHPHIAAGLFMTVGLIIRWWYFDDVRSKMGNLKFFIISLLEVTIFLALMSLLNLGYASLIRLFVIVSSMISFSMVWVYLYGRS